VAASPGPGECTWVDRPIDAQEPFWLVWRFSERARTIERIMFGSAEGRSGVYLPPNQSGSEYVTAMIMEVQDPQLRRLIDAIHLGHPFAVECYNDGSGMFVVTRLLI
jgi:hypothetical protein